MIKQDMVVTLREHGQHAFWISLHTFSLRERERFREAEIMYVHAKV